MAFIFNKRKSALNQIFYNALYATAEQYNLRTKVHR